MDDLLRNEIAEAGREQDRLLAEHDQWMARRNAARAAPVSEPPSPGLITKDYGGNVLATAPQPRAAASEGDWSQWEAWMAGHLAIMRAEIHDKVARSMGTLIVELERQWREDIEQAERSDDEIAKLQIELDRLRGQINRLKREAAGDRAEMRRERALLYDEIKLLRRRCDLAEHGQIDELPRKARNHDKAKRRA